VSAVVDFSVVLKNRVIVQHLRLKKLHINQINVNNVQNGLDCSDSLADVMSDSVDFTGTLKIITVRLIID
jgi:hypothetical protein